MPSTAIQDHNKQHLELIADRLKTGALSSVKELIASLYPGEIAHLLEALLPENRKLVWHLVDPSKAGLVLIELHEDVRIQLIEDTDAQELITAAGTLDSSHLVELLRDFPSAILDKVLDAMGESDKNRFEEVLSFADKTAGGLMSLEVLTVRAEITLDVVLRYLHLRGEMPPLTDSLMVVDRDGHFQGVLPLSTLLTKDSNATVSEVMNTKEQAIPADLDSSEIAILFQQRNLVSAPVISNEGKLLGRITIDDVVDVIREEADHSLMSMAGLDEDSDMFAPVFESTQRRSVWLAVNLGTAFLASWVIGLFEATLEQIVALAVLMPIVASMGGVAGSQTLTVVIRGLALKQIVPSNSKVLLLKELAIGCLNGVLWAFIVMLIASMWFESIGLGLLLGGAMVITLIFASLAGTLIPILLDKMGIDPALAGGVLLTTVTDVTGFMAFLGLATIFLV